MLKKFNPDKPDKQNIVLCPQLKSNHKISSGKQNQISRKLTPETHEIVVVTFAGKLNHVYSLLKPQTLRYCCFLLISDGCLDSLIIM